MRTEGLARESVRLLFVTLVRFSDKTEGLSHAMIFLDGRIMVLGELLTG
jgi:hypothetical protein